MYDIWGINHSRSWLIITPETDLKRGIELGFNTRYGTRRDIIIVNNADPSEFEDLNVVLYCTDDRSCRLGV